MILMDRRYTTDEITSFSPNSSHPLLYAGNYRHTSESSENLQISCRTKFLGVNFEEKLET